MIWLVLVIVVMGGPESVNKLWSIDGDGTFGEWLAEHLRFY
jgi:hypothetical protein